MKKKHFLIGALCLLLSPACLRATEGLMAGASKVDITPSGPVQLINVKLATECTNVAQRLFARALAIGEGADAVVLLSFDGIGVPATLAGRVARGIRDRTGMGRQQVAICATHTHWAPHLTGLLEYIYGGPLPESAQRNVDAYTDRLVARLVEAAIKALVARRPSRLEWTTGSLGIAANRRLEDGGHVIRDNERGLMITWNPDGPVDHALPVMTVRDIQTGALTAVHVTYACHNVALTGSTAIGGFTNTVHGDWVGLAMEELERRHPGCVAVGTIGCGGDLRPNFCGGESVAAAHGKTLADEFDRLLSRTVGWSCVRGPVRTGWRETELPLEPLPAPGDLEKQASDRRPGALILARAAAAERRLKQREQGRAEPDGVPFIAQSWRFTEGPRWVFLSGEVCVDYQLRIKRELGADVWPVAYANATPCYIVSARMLEQGGYEAGNSMYYYGWIRPLRPSAEGVVMRAVADVLK